MGTGGHLQVPALEGLRYRFPLMHDGCAETLEQRFVGDCGGPSHGQVDIMMIPNTGKTNCATDPEGAVFALWEADGRALPERRPSRPRSDLDAGPL